jgi:anti-sigma regulatory factor (Ser/Thr protein kinase)
MVDRALLHEALRHVDQAAFALSDDVTEQGRTVALAQLREVRALLSAAAYEQAAPARGAPATVPDDRQEQDDGPALVERVRLDGELTAPSAGRAFVHQTCATWQVPAAAASTVVDVASELVSNAARHAGGPIDLTLELRGEHVVISVTDRSHVPPRLLPYRRGVSEQGIGLRLVDQLSESWGWSAAREGKRVWARAALTETPAPLRAARRGAPVRRPSAGAR